jgi:hypothetical protein
MDGVIYLFLFIIIIILFFWQWDLTQLNTGSFQCIIPNLTV